MQRGDHGAIQNARLDLFVITPVPSCLHLPRVTFLGLILGTEWVDPEDPTVIAETELLGAAASIEAAAKKLEQLKPRAKPKVSVHWWLLVFGGEAERPQPAVCNSTV